MLPELLVATDLDFSRLRGTRPVAAGQWDDVQQAEVEREGFLVTLRLQLRGGKTFTAHDDAPGWDDLIEHAEDALNGFPDARSITEQLNGHTGPVTIYMRTE
jgi:hypothetical protein